ncbi:AEC family transporter [Rothia sp. AR01]|uniref:AEC family transporter n=1 Tax=Rothia santali TaxID=2949643 RepID=A0A9X2KH94_9MICC|nr:AEC family transporter [Rothia santali]MCP3424479.1 AEC family transporter [Rothia santali]
MLSALTAIGPLFAVLAIGGMASVSSRMRAIGPSLTVFVLTFALPAFLFNAVTSAPVREGIPWTFTAIAFGVTALMSTLTWVSGRLLGAGSGGVAAPLALAVGYGNVGYMGVPITLSVLGPEAGLAAAMGQLIHNVMFMLGYPLARMLSPDRGGDVSVRKMLWTAARKAILTNPVTLSVAAGVGVSLLGVRLPAMAVDTLELVGQVAVPLAMFVVGLSLPTVGAGLRDGSVPRIPLAIGTAIKLLLLPVATVAALAVLDPRMGQPWASTLILMAAMPTSTTAFILSQQEDRDPRLVSGMIATTSLLGVVTIPTVLALFVS